MSAPAGSLHGFEGGVGQVGAHRICETDMGHGAAFHDNAVQVERA